MFEVDVTVHGITALIIDTDTKLVNELLGVLEPIL